MFPVWRQTLSLAAMKTPTILVPAIALALSLQFSAFADDGTSLSFIKTKTGKVYTNCKVFKTDPDGVIIAHQHGGAKLLFTDLSDSTRALLGYDEKKAEAYEKERAEKKAKEREEIWKYRREVAKAQAAAYTAEAMRQEFISVQNIASAGGYGYGWDGLYGFGYNAHGYGRGNHYGRPPHWSQRGRTDLYPAHSGNGGGINVRGRTFFGPPQRSVPLATPAMGPLTPALGGSR